MTFLALGGKCGGRGASGWAGSIFTLFLEDGAAARPSSASRQLRAIAPTPTPHWPKKWRRVAERIADWGLRIADCDCDWGSISTPLIENVQAIGNRYGSVNQVVHGSDDSFRRQILAGIVVAPYHENSGMMTTRIGYQIVQVLKSL